jgi:hypothetical protein
MIDEKLAADFVTKFIEVTGGKWTNIYSEIQGDGEEFLLVVNAPQAEVGNLDDSTRKRIVGALNALIPVKPEDPVGSWVIGFKHEGEIYDSILANEF